MMIDAKEACTTYRIAPAQLEHFARFGDIASIVTHQGTTYRADDVARCARVLHDARVRRAIRHQSTLIEGAGDADQS